MAVTDLRRNTMGSWNKTCGLTNLPIMCGEKTYVFVLERESD